jgi:photosystem II stability/assembly factor-like uncharacterized protein
VQKILQLMLFSGVFFCALLLQNVQAQQSLIMPLSPQSLLLDIESASGRLVAVGERGHILLSDDRGESWQQASVPTRQMLTAVYFAGEQRGWAVGHDGLVLATVDAGEHWVIQRDGLQEQQRLHQQKLVQLEGQRESLRGALLAADSREQREEFQLQLEDLELDIEDIQLALDEPVNAPPLLDVYFHDELRGIAVGAFNTLLLTSDGGVSWEHLSKRLDNPDEYHLNAVTGDGRGNVWIAGESGVLFRSGDFGERWSRLHSPYPGSWFGISRAPQSGHLLVFGLRGNVFRSRDGGDNWQVANTQSDRSLAGGGYLSTRYVMLVGAVGTLLVSEDGGATFKQRKLKNRINLSGVALAGDRAVLVGQGGVHITEGVGGGL